MNQRLLSSRYPYIPVRLRIAGRFGDVILEEEALVDTGFDGEVILPEALYSLLGVPDSTTSILLPTGERTTPGAFDAEIELPGIEGRVPATALVLGGEFLVGLRIVQNYRVILDHGREVIVEP